MAPSAEYVGACLRLCCTAGSILQDRLVEFDRNSAARTSVIDDQSDYFAIDSNVWLDEAERRALADRQAAIEAAEAERRSRITVAIDLMGRKVHLHWRHHH